MSLEPKADDYNTKINTIKTDFFSILGGYKQKYIDYFTDISDIEAEESYNECILDLQTKNQDLFVLANRIQNDIDALDNNMKMMKEKLSAEKTLNNNNSDLFEDIQTTNSGSEIMINDYKMAYNNQYYKNIQLVIGIILMIGISSKIFRK